MGDERFQSPLDNVTVENDISFLWKWFQSLFGKKQPRPPNVTYHFYFQQKTFPAGRRYLHSKEMEEQKGEVRSDAYRYTYLTFSTSR